jgi:glycosyltransferase involved in cell wall biosynthesis
MNLLVLSPWFPFPPDNGSRLRAFHLIRVLAEQGHRIRLVAGVQEDSPSGPIPEPLQDLCDEVIAIPWRWYDGGTRTGRWGAARAALSHVPRSVREADNPGLREAVARAWQNRSTDAVLAFELGIDPFLPEEGGGTPVVLDQVELSGLERAYRTAKSVPRRLRHRLAWSKGARYWGKRLRRYSALTAVSTAEVDIVRRVLGRETPPVHLLPNGVPVDAYPPRIRERIVPGRLIYNGALTYGPNRDAVYWFVQEILPRVVEQVPEAHLVVTGRCEARDAATLASNPRVRLTDFLPDLRPALLEAAACVVPLRTGGGTRLKILEAWAAGVPVVATSVGAAGLEGEDGTHYRRADTAEALAKATVTLLQDSVHAEGLARKARALVTARYDWAALGGQLAGMLETLTHRA